MSNPLTPQTVNGGTRKAAGLGEQASVAGLALALSVPLSSFFPPIWGETVTIVCVLGIPMAASAVRNWMDSTLGARLANVVLR